MVPIISAIVLLFLSAGSVFGQANDPVNSETGSHSDQAISLEVPVGTPLPVVLDKELRLRKEGQTIHGKIAEPVYAYDKLVVPAGSEVTGTVIRIAGVSARKRVLEALNGNFSPNRDVEIQFDQLTLPDGRRVPLHTHVSPASQGVLHFATAPEHKDANKKSAKSSAEKRAAEKVSQTKQEINRDWETAKQQISAPGRIHRLERILIAQLPVHPQYIDKGTRFNAELLNPLNFGTEELSPDKMQMVGTTPVPGSIIHALLTTPLSSASSRKGEGVEAVMTEPLFTNNQLILPEGTQLKGSVIQVQPARRWHRNGQLRIVFHQVVPPETPEQHVEASLEGVEVKESEHLSLDSEGGAQATTPKTRYLTTGISIALAASSFAPDADAGRSLSQSGGEASNRALNGASGFRIIGIAVGVLVRSRALASSFGVYGASMSIYDHFLSRGNDVVYPKDTAMAIGFGSRVTSGPKFAPQS